MVQVLGMLGGALGGMAAGGAASAAGGAAASALGGAATSALGGSLAGSALGGLGGMAASALGGGAAANAAGGILNSRLASRGMDQMGSQPPQQTGRDMSMARMGMTNQIPAQRQMDQQQMQNNALLDSQKKYDYMRVNDPRFMSDSTFKYLR